jgi:hypothetical protein
MGLMDLLVAVVSAILGWRNGRLGERELKGIAIVVLGWTAVTTVASLPYVSLTGLAAVLVVRTLLVGAPYALAVFARRLRRRRG